MSLDAMKQALAALEEINQLSIGENAICLPAEIDTTMDALRAAIEQAQEPVAWVGPSWLNPETRTWESESFAPRPINGWIPLYTAPRQWQGLTDEELNQIYAEPQTHAGQYARAIEAKLKERNT